MNNVALYIALAYFFKKVIEDLISFRKARIENPDVEFDWVLSVLSALLGSLVGFTGGMGAESLLNVATGGN